MAEGYQSEISKAARSELERRYGSDIDAIFQMQPSLELDLHCLKRHLCVEENNDKVKLDKFGNFTLWFGPILEHGYPTFLCRVSKLILPR